MKKKSRAFLILDNMLGFFLVMQAFSIIPLCIIPTHKKLIAVQNTALLKVACWQKLQQPHIDSLILKNQKYTFKKQGAKLEVLQKNQRLEYDTKQKTFRIFTQ
ncbi:hypothetical protein [Bombilactobacillus bombi]|uniref:hypothetical protein n=1 Tax=Bombilactobacillus bombi TaxID=1303590 RepID=UPI0015E5C64C|nr:hypothetical protein [Bombilactobacillus bombi]MBA1434856.1 hypothetical protein [Bombilactobacillus bombi]